ncbi:ANTAR domain-containing protein [Sciscionella marina]|uniref:ANTAR domain-containing protein n=1 Tax=Sciscionella marina TaxID=508770 RepID=UPI001F08F210|nr:ANTAR domain-containing protein [Sciscionella marina]
MERFGVDAGTAFSMLVSSSQTRNLKLVDVARWLVQRRNPRQPPGWAITPPTRSRWACVTTRSGR